MAYTKSSWSEKNLTEALKIQYLNNLETQYTEMFAYLESLTHATRYYTEAECTAKYFSAASDGTGSDLVAEKLDGYTYNDILDAGIPSGVIAIWSGSVVGIPSGWVLCNGSNGTPDLRGMFVVGAGTSYVKGATGGTSTITASATVSVATHALTAAETPLHEHTGITDQYISGAKKYHLAGSAGDGWEVPLIDRTIRTEYAGSGVAHGHEGSTYEASVDQNKLPAYYALCYIQKS